MPIRPEMQARYPKDWKARSRFVRFYRARNRCEWCGAENYEPHPITGSRVVLTTAHVYDMRPEASDLLNLAALCPAVPQYARCPISQAQPRLAQRANGDGAVMPGRLLERIGNTQHMEDP